MTTCRWTVSASGCIRRSASQRAASALRTQSSTNRPSMSRWHRPRLRQRSGWAETRTAPSGYRRRRDIARARCRRWVRWVLQRERAIVVDRNARVPRVVAHGIRQLAIEYEGTRWPRQRGKADRRPRYRRWWRHLADGTGRGGRRSVTARSTQKRQEDSDRANGTAHHAACSQSHVGILWPGNRNAVRRPVTSRPTPRLSLTWG